VERSWLTAKILRLELGCPNFERKIANGKGRTSSGNAET